MRILIKETEGLPQYKFFLLLSSISVSILLICDCLIYKIVSIGPGLWPISAFIYPLSYFFGDVIAEVYGYQLSRQLIWCTFVCNILFCSIISIAIYLPSPDFSQPQSAYIEVFGKSMRTAIGGTAGIVTGAFINAFMISKLKIIMLGQQFWIRSLVATAIGEGVMHLIAYSIQFVGTYSLNKVFTLILSAWLFKCLYAVVVVIPASIFVKFLKKAEKVDVYDMHLRSYNPFSFSNEIPTYIEPQEDENTAFYNR